MKPFKMLGLGTLLVLLAMALGGASSAMAEGMQLCSEDESPCAKENLITHVHETTPEGKKATILSSIANVECEVLFLGEMSEGATEGPALITGNFTYAGCKTSSGTGCEVSETSEGSSLETLREGHETDSVTGEGEFNVHCGSLINCTYNLEGLKAIGKGALLSTLKNGEVPISEQTLKKVGGILCPKTTKLDITTTPLTETFLAPAVMYCARYINSRGGYLLGPNQTECEAFDGGRSFNYELIWGPAGLTTGSMVCVLRRNPGGLFYLTRNGALCGNKHPMIPLGKFELGEIA